MKKTIQGKEMTREEFQLRWSQHFDQFFRLVETDAEMSQVRRIREEIVELAGRDFDRL